MHPHLDQLVRDVALGRMDPYARLKPQVEKILGAGLRPVHLDTHKHTHLLPPVLEAMARLGEEFGIPWLRQPCDFSSYICAAGNTPQLYGGPCCPQWLLRMQAFPIWRG